MNLVIVVGVVLAVSACADCETSGCDALKGRVEQQGSGIGGVVAEKSDVEANGCAECPFGEARVDVWATDGALEPDEAAALTTAESPASSVAASKRYHVALAAGSYLLCVQRQCVNVAVSADETLTVNLKRRYGPTGFWMLDPETSAMSETFGFDLPSTD